LSGLADILDLPAADAGNPQGCGTAGHPIECLCDVHVAAPVPVLRAPQWRHVREARGSLADALFGSGLEQSARLLYLRDMAVLMDHAVLEDVAA